MCVRVHVYIVTVMLVYRSMLEAFVTDELRAADRTFSRSKVMVM